MIPARFIDRIRSPRLRSTESDDEKLDGDMAPGLPDRKTRSGDPGFVKSV